MSESDPKVASPAEPIDTPADVPGWYRFRGDRQPRSFTPLPPPPPWRPFRTSEVHRSRAIPAPDDLPPAMRHKARTFRPAKVVVEMVNAALYLRRPLLVTGVPGSGKSSLIDAVAYEIGLGIPLRWSVTSRSTLREGLYEYDAVGRLQEQQSRSSAGDATDSILPYLRLGPLGTALLPTDVPRALLIDEIDKADLDLPNDLLNVLEEGEFEIRELSRLQQKDSVEVRTGDVGAGSYPIEGGVVRMKEFPFVVMTSNGERTFPPAFLRRCLQLQMPDPAQDPDELRLIVEAHLREHLEHDLAARADIDGRIQEFVDRARKGPGSLATDQLLNAIFLVSGRANVPEGDRDELVKRVTRTLT